MTYLCLNGMLKCMRTTLRLDDRLFRAVKRLAADSHRTFAAVIEDAIRELLARRLKTRSAEPLKLPTFRGGGIQPGVDLDHSAALFDVMEGRD